MGYFLIQAILVRRDLVKPLPRHHTRHLDRDTQSSAPGSVIGPSVTLAMVHDCFSDFGQWGVDVPTSLEESEQSGHKSQGQEFPTLVLYIRSERRSRLSYSGSMTDDGHGSTVRKVTNLVSGLPFMLISTSAPWL